MALGPAPVTETEAMRDYERSRDLVTARLRALEALLDGQRLSAVRTARLRVERSKFVLAVVGEFSSGKSFLLNALLGRFHYEESPPTRRVSGLLATDINPSTATITLLEYGSQDEATALYEDGRCERIPLDALSRFVAVGREAAPKLHDAAEAVPDAPVRVTITVDSPFLARGFAVADTPGLASINPAHRRATLQFLPTADAVLYLIDTQQPFAEGDASFLGIVRQHIDSIFIVQTKIDLWRALESDGLPAWKRARERIARLAAVHAPETYVYALSAREYVEGVLDEDAAAIDRSRFPRFLAALDASLVARTGRARLSRAADVAAAAASDECALLEHDVAMLALDVDALRLRRESLLPELARIDEGAAAQRDALLDAGLRRRRAIEERGRVLADELERALTKAFDTADVARLRDRERLHVIVDRVVSEVAADFAGDVAAATFDDVEAALAEAATLVPIRWSSADAAATAFGARPGTSFWATDGRTALAATIVLEAIGGPAIGLVADINARFAARPPGAYMKREMLADLRVGIFPRLRGEATAFAARVGARLQQPYGDLGDAIAGAAVARRDADLGSIERALLANERNEAPARAIALRERGAEIDRTVARVRAAAASPARPGPDLGHANAIPAAVRAAHADPAFDRTSYDRGLRPERWRVAVLGPLRRGKSSLINAFAGRRILTDDDAGSVRFPIHVRYGEREVAYALGDDGQWEAIAFELVAQTAAQRAVLALVPWEMPRELVLVHAPAFDSGDPHAEDVNVVVASHASEVLCLFSRQLSDRELALYERVAEFGRPMLFAHTMADNEAASERRRVVELAGEYLERQRIAADRIFVVSAHEYDAARQARRAAAGWNEMQALRATLESHAQEHMAGLERRLRTAASQRAREPQHPAEATPKRGLLGRLFGKGR